MSDSVKTSLPRPLAGTQKDSIGIAKLSRLILGFPLRDNSRVKARGPYGAMFGLVFGPQKLDC